MAFATSTMLLLGGTGISYAYEGSFNSYLSQVQPGFHSRTWTDFGNSKDSTIVTLDDCKVNRGGAAYGTTKLQSVGITLYKDGRPVGTITQPCGTYDFGNRGSGRYYFRVVSINGNESSNRKTFLNVETVTVMY